MRRSVLLLFVCCLLSQWSMAQAPKWLDKTQKAIFSIITYDKDNNILNTGNGFFVTAEGVALSDYSLFKGADHAMIVDSDGKKMPVNAIMGADDLYDVIKFRVNVDKNVPFLPLAATSPAVEENIYLLPYATQKERLFTPGKIKEISKAGDNHKYYTLELKLGDKQVSCPVTNLQGAVIGIAQKSGSNTDVNCYAVGASLAMALQVNALSLNDITLNSIGIKKALPDTEDQALVYLFMASSQTTPERYADLLNDFVAQYPNSVDGYIRRATNLVFTSTDASGIEKAVADLNKALNISQSKDEVHYNISRLMYNYVLAAPADKKYGEWTQEKALEEIRKAYHINPLPVYKQQEGDILFALQDYAGSYACYEDVMKTDIASPAIYYSASRAKIMLGVQTEEVLALMDSCIAKCPLPMSADNAPFLLERAELYMDMQKFRPAMLDYDQYEEAMRGAVNDVFYYYREQACLQAKQYQRALDDIAKAIRMAPQNALYRTELGAINLRVGRYEESLEAFNQAIALSPDYAEPYRLLGVAYVQLKKKNEACQNLQKAKELGDPIADSLIEKHCK